MPDRVLDYLLVPTDPWLRAVDLDGVVPAGWEGPIQLNSEIWIEYPSDDLRERMLNACAFPGEQWRPARQFGAIYAFVREIDWTDTDRHQHLYVWNEDDALLTVLALSRLIRPHETGCAYAIRRIISAGQPDTLMPHDAGEARGAFRIDQDDRNWLDVDEARQLQALVAAYDPDALPVRIRRALWFCELMVRQRYLEDALPLIATGLEALVNTGTDRASAQFIQRTAALSNELAIELSEARCRDAYRDRSAVVHGRQLDLTRPVKADKFLQTLAALQQTLRAAVRKAIEDPAFRVVFADETVIESRWPLRAPHPQSN